MKCLCFVAKKPLFSGVMKTNAEDATARQWTRSTMECQLWPFHLQPAINATSHYLNSNLANTRQSVFLSSITVASLSLCLGLGFRLFVEHRHGMWWIFRRRTMHLAIREQRNPGIPYKAQNATLCFPINVDPHAGFAPFVGNSGPQKASESFWKFSRSSFRRFALFSSSSAPSTISRFCAWFSLTRSTLSGS